MPRKRTGSPMRQLHDDEATEASHSKPRVPAVPKLPPPDAVEMATRVRGKVRSAAKPKAKPPRTRR